MKLTWIEGVLLALFVAIVVIAFTACSTKDVPVKATCKNVVMHTDFYYLDSTFDYTGQPQNLGILCDSTLKVLIDTAKKQDKILRQCSLGLLTHDRYDIGDSLS